MNHSGNGEGGGEHHGMAKEEGLGYSGHTHYKGCVCWVAFHETPWRIHKVAQHQDGGVEKKFSFFHIAEEGVLVLLRLAPHA